MNDKDKQEFEKAMKKLYNQPPSELWQAALEYERFNHKYCVVGSLDKLCEKLEAENKRLREALESIANSKNYPEPDYLIAREALKETNDK
jgi:hypothetical protein